MAATKWYVYNLKVVYCHSFETILIINHKNAIAKWGWYPYIMNLLTNTNTTLRALMSDDNHKTKKEQITIPQPIDHTILDLTDDFAPLFNPQFLQFETPSKAQLDSPKVFRVVS